MAAATRVIEGGEHPGYAELQMPWADYAVLSEAVADFPKDLVRGHEGDAMDWMESRGREVRADLSQGLMSPLDKFVAGEPGHAVVLVSTPDPRGEVGPTPLDHMPQSKNILHLPDLRRGVLVGAMGLHGYGYTSQQEGVLFNNMIVAESSRGLPNVASGVGGLDMHTEDCSYSEGYTGGISPDVLGLHYLRNTERVTTPIAVPDLSALPSNVRDTMWEERFLIPTSVAHGGDANDSHNRVALLYGDPAKPSLRFNVQQMLSIRDRQDSTALNTIEALAAHAGERATTLVMEPGDMLWLNNRQALHAKGPHVYEEPPGKGRWQRRLAMVHDLARIQPFFAENRVVDASAFIGTVRAQG